MSVLEHTCGRRHLQLCVYLGNGRENLVFDDMDVIATSRLK